MLWNTYSFRTSDKCSGRRPGRTSLQLQQSHCAAPQPCNAKESSSLPTCPRPKSHVPISAVATRRAPTPDSHFHPKPNASGPSTDSLTRIAFRRRTSAPVRGTCPEFRCRRSGESLHPYSRFYATPCSGFRWKRHVPHRSRVLGRKFDCPGSRSARSSRVTARETAVASGRASDAGHTLHDICL
jgi:hypothetical protein